MSGLKLYLSILVIPAILVALCLFWGLLERERLREYDHIITMASERYQIPEPLIRAVIWRESRFHADAIGQAGERGLMQVMPPAGKEWAQQEKLDNFQPEDLLNPRINIMAGSWYLSRATRRWPEADLPYVVGLAEYNAGRVHALRWARGLDPLTADAFIERIDFPTTRRYILDVVERYRHYENDPDDNLFSLAIDQLRYLWFKWREEQELELSGEPIEKEEDTNIIVE